MREIGITLNEYHDNEKNVLIYLNITHIFTIVFIKHL
jgi:hypothetical protein